MSGSRMEKMGERGLHQSEVHKQLEEEILTLSDDEINLVIRLVTSSRI